MEDFGKILENHVLIVAVIACLIAQASKLVLELIWHGKVNFRALTTTGGMPSAHSAFVSALATGVGQTSGWSSPEFAIAVVFATIVMYDATGIRRAAGQQARILNQMLDELFQEHPQFNENRLKELLGHTPIEVLVGLSMGVVICVLSEITT